MLDPEAIAVDPDLLLFNAAKAKSGNSGSRSVVFSDSRGRYVKPMLPRGPVRRIAVDATLWAAAPYQKIRREREPNRTVIVEEGDPRAKLLQRKAGSLVVFLVDASGSMVTNHRCRRQGRRDPPAHRGLREPRRGGPDPPRRSGRGGATPTRSSTVARRRLESMPCGGGSPLPSLAQAACVGATATPAISARWWWWRSPMVAATCP